MKRTALFFFAALLFLSAFGFHTFADSSPEKELTEDYGKLFGTLPESIGERLPDGATGEDPLTDAEAMTDWRYIFSVISDAVGIELSRALPMLCSLCGLLIVSSVLECMRSALSPRFGDILSACCSCAVCTAAVALQYDTLVCAAKYIGDLCKLANLLLPLTVSLYAVGGNISAASVSGGAFGIFLSICENLLSKTVVPFSGICLAFAVSGCISSHIDLRPLAATVKKTYTTALGFLMTLFCTVTAAQNAIAAGSDSLGLRAAKFVAGSAIPVVGGSVSESMRTLAASIGMLRKSIGVCGIVMIFLLFLPTLISLLLIRAANSLAASFGAILGCSKESALLSELSSVYGYICAVLCMCSLMLIFILTLLVGAAAVGG